jgi:hypothetical protein
MEQKNGQQEEKCRRARGMGEGGYRGVDATKVKRRQIEMRPNMANMQKWSGEMASKYGK